VFRRRRARRKITAVSATRYRVILSILGLLLGALAVGAVILAPSGDVTELPDAVERYSPADGSIVQRQTALEIQLAPGYRLDLVVDGVPIPVTELDITEETGRHVFRPEAWKSIPEWLPGFHIVEITFDRSSGLPDPGSLRWSFRTQ
jgi:hypothetical protein